MKNEALTCWCSLRRELDPHALNPEKEKHHFYHVCHVHIFILPNTHSQTDRQTHIHVGVRQGRRLPGAGQDKVLSVAKKRDAVLPVPSFLTTAYLRPLKPSPPITHIHILIHSTPASSVTSPFSPFLSYRATLFYSHVKLHIL